uniref:cellulose 1,4-beta-cellobiosidase (non-reducing end) n=1 Tax=Haptolina brevifila TaxID=156173 RepID=A0A7S2G673_9EUKA|mmetsp:Transcript_2778/g.5860  ORF Transcript_2778/g.5860 Transcript_2778/m.5860 type:complete len:238 (+) Transcript_2778:74-787(+)
MLLALLTAVGASILNNATTHSDFFGVRPLGSPAAYIKTTPVGNYPEGFAEESYNGYEGEISGSGHSLTVRGNVRTYWVKDVEKHDWSQIRYKALDLRGKSLRFTADVSRVGCACNAALYLVGMPSGGHGGSSGYCDIQGVGDRECLEIDLLEGNRKAIQTTLHTQTGKKADGTCNQYGCAVNWGKSSQEHYGTASMIDSGRPYEVDAAFDQDGHMTVRLGQDGTWHSCAPQRLNVID